MLSHLDSHLLNASCQKPLSQKELKYVARRVLEALKVLHEDGYVHTGSYSLSRLPVRVLVLSTLDVKPDNIFVNYKEQDQANDDDSRFSDIQLGDLGGTSPVDSKWAKQGIPVGAPIWNSPEVVMETSWNTATDIWSFGAVVCLPTVSIVPNTAPSPTNISATYQVISLIYGGNFNLFRPKTVPHGHEEYGLEVLKQQFRYFGPFPGKYEEIAGQMTVAAIIYLMQEIPQSQTTPFSRTVERGVGRKDKEFLGRIMKMDWRDRPSAKELLDDEWFEGVE